MESPEHHSPVAVVGAGAIGLALASAFARAGRPVIVCGGSTSIERITVTENGIPESWPVVHTTNPDELAGVETAIVAVKAHQTDSAATWLRALARPEVTVLVAQNGVEHRQRIAPYTQEARLVPAVVYLNVERTAPGEAILRRVGDADLTVPEDEPTRRIASELEAGRMRVRRAVDFDTIAWAKLLTNITANPLTALTGRRAEVIHDPAVGGIARTIMSEAVQVAQAAGAGLTQKHADAAMAWLESVPVGATTSMRQDRLAGRPLEYDALTGAVVRTAEHYGIDVPVNRLVLALVAAIRPDESQ